MGLNNILSISEAGKVGFYDKSTGIFSLLSNLNKSINAAPAIGNFVLISDSEGTLHCWLGPTPDYSPTRTFEGTYSPTPTITATMTSTELVSYTPTPTGTNGPTTIRINCGGSGYTDTDGNLWQEDVQYSAGAWGYTGYSNQASTETGILDGAIHSGINLIYQMGSTRLHSNLRKHNLMKRGEGILKLP
jgi:hypothetical protein